MKRLNVNGGNYIDALPTGEYVCLMTGKPYLSTHLGPVITQDGLSPLFVRCTAIGGRFKFAGQSSNSPETLEWVEGFGWRRVPIVAAGVSPVIYDNAGELRIVPINSTVGSQGYRYVDPETGRLVTGDETYGSPNFALSEWSYVGDGLYVGQCNIRPGVGVWDGATMRLLTEGSPHFIRTQRRGELVSIAFVQENGNPSVAIWATVAELRALPAVVPPVPPPQPVPAPPPAPSPTPVPTPGPIVPNPGPTPTPSPQPLPAPMPAPLPPLLGGSILMADIAGVLQHLGTNKQPDGKLTLTANKDGGVWSVQPDGKVEIRPKGTAGPYEVGVLDGQVWSVKPEKAIYSFVLANVSGL